MSEGNPHFVLVPTPRQTLSRRAAATLVARGLNDLHDLLRGVEAWIERAKIARNEGRFTEFFQYIQLALQLDPNDADALDLLGIAYHDGCGTTQDLAGAIRYFRRAGEQGHCEAQFHLGACYWWGHGVERDYGEAAKWFRRAADQGNANAQYRLAGAYDVWGRGVPVDHAEALNLYRNAADQGHRAAEYELGNKYRFGRGVKRDLHEAAHWFKKAAGQGHVDAQCWLGFWYSVEGPDEIRDTTEALRWFRSAAEHGDRLSQRILGHAYSGEDREWTSYSGIFSYSLLPIKDRDLVQAVYWYGKAAEQGDIPSEIRLGKMCQTGRGVPRDLERAAEWFRRAAREGDPEAQKGLQECTAQ